MGYQSITKHQDTNIKKTSSIKKQIPIRELNLGTWLLVFSWFLIFGFWLLQSSIAFAQTTFDPLTIGIGARALGMGSAYVAVAEEGDTMFSNPAGLGEIDNFMFSSMSGKLMEDASYTMLGGVYPLGNRSAVGVGYVAATVTSIALRDGAGTATGLANFNNNVLFASYGRKFGEKFSLGFNLKYFSQDGTGNNSGDGTGFNLDVGMLQQGLGFFSFGAVGQNLLANNKIKYSSGQEESLPRVIKLGTRMHLLGKKIPAAFFSELEVHVLADTNIFLQTAKTSTMHYGLEMTSSKNLSLRVGLDQSSQFTWGVSLKSAGLGFHYAYHPFGEIYQNSAHFFSISFDERGWPINKNFREFFRG